MMKQKSLLLFILSLVPSGPALSYVAQEGNISGLFAVTGSLTDAPGFESDARPVPRGGLGLIALGDINEKGSLEIAMFHLNKSFYREDQGIQLAEEAQNMHITMGYRRWWTPRVSGSLAVSSAYSMGTPRRTFVKGRLPEDFATSARKVVAYGAEFSIQSELWSKGTSAVVLDTRYSLSMSAEPGERSSHFLAALGFRYLIQDRVPPPESVLR